MCQSCREQVQQKSAIEQPVLASADDGAYCGTLTNGAGDLIGNRTWNTAPFLPSDEAVI